MSARPNIHCPYCDAIFSADELPTRRRYRNKYGIDVFTCPECDEPIKIEPTEFMFARQQIMSGELPDDAAIGAAPESDRLPSEQAAMDGGRKGCLPIIACVGIGITSALCLLSEWPVA